ncbi:hypothetical protein [Pseudovibrio sp. Tun.PSC04-5.I4]|uniref:hypothetical protein n=1 Tax=Pseudovibrio sp. Tun.PSC04-5.I4 TaxID=1798213 RepID=UPI00088CE707|nr:hypothetical protein [Pseudovibrio sp. Tun.PSC04-5.I4]SDQ31454.1 hypothetical protein SAMN04515695_0789 [Pseudovibrio sp. Tun.PSC04-5.I4]
MKPTLNDWAWLTHCVCQAMLGSMTANLMHVQLHYILYDRWVLRFYVLDEQEFRGDAEDILEEMGAQIDFVSNFLSPQGNLKVTGEVISNIPAVYERQSETIRWILSRKNE